MGKKDQEEEKLPGVPYGRFKAAIDAVVTLRDKGDFLPFLARASQVRLIGSIDTFREVFAEKLGIESVEQPEARETIREIEEFLGAWSAFRGLEPLLSFLEGPAFRGEFEALDDERKAQFRTQLKDKAEYVRTRLFTPAMAQRAERFRTTVEPSLEDLDVEVISERRDQLRGHRVSVPFLRLRVRYGEGPDQPLPAPLFRVLFGSIPGMSLYNDVKSFELEADEADIDLLLRRLIAAKELLLKAVEGEPKPAE